MHTHTHTRTVPHHLLNTQMKLCILKLLFLVVSRKMPCRRCRAFRFIDITCRISGEKYESQRKSGKSSLTGTWTLRTKICSFQSFTRTNTYTRTLNDCAWIACASNCDDSRINGWWLFVDDESFHLLHAHNVASFASHTLTLDRHGRKRAGEKNGHFEFELENFQLARSRIEQKRFRFSAKEEAKHNDDNNSTNFNQLKIIVSFSSSTDKFCASVTS